MRFEKIFEIFYPGNNIREFEFCIISIYQTVAEDRKIFFFMNAFYFHIGMSHCFICTWRDIQTGTFINNLS